MAKNSNGAGSIYKDKTSGRWVGAVTVLDVDGNRRRRKVVARTQAEAKTRLDALREEIEAEELGHLPASATIGRFLESWLSDVLPLSDITDVTRDHYTRITRLYVIPNLPSRKTIAELSPADVRRMIARLREQGLSASTQRSARMVLGRALRTAEADGLVTRNVARLVDGVKSDHVEGRTLTPDEARRLLSAAEGHEYEALIWTMLALGLRKGEALGLSWSDVDLEGAAPKLTVRRAIKKRANDELYLDAPKTARSRRTVHLPGPLVDVLRTHRARQAEQRLAFGEGWGGRWSDEELVFTTSIGTPPDPNRVNRQVQALAAAAELGKVTPHTLRHSAASLLLAQGVPLKVVSETLGHSSIRVTADVYGHLLDDARAGAASAMEAVLG